MVGQIIPCKTHGIICPTIPQKRRTGYALPLRDLALPEAQVEEITDKVKDELENEDKGVVMESLVSYIAV